MAKTISGAEFLAGLDRVVAAAAVPVAPVVDQAKRVADLVAKMRPRAERMAAAAVENGATLTVRYGGNAKVTGSICRVELGNVKVTRGYVDQHFRVWLKSASGAIHGPFNLAKIPTGGVK